MRLTVFIGLALCATPAAAGTLFSNLGAPGNVYDTSGPSNVEGTAPNISQARPFSVAGVGLFDLTQFDLGVTKSSGSSGNTFNASIWTDTSGQPGIELGNWDLATTEPVNGCCGLTTQSGITGVTLTGGTSYWMVLGPQSLNDGSRVFWTVNTTGQTSAILGSLDGGATWIHDGSGQNAAFDVLGNAPASVPEPGSLLLLGGGLVCIATARRAGKRRNA
jgi:hypothetical protein